MAYRRCPRRYSNRKMLLLLLVLILTIQAYMYLDLAGPPKHSINVNKGHLDEQEKHNVLNVNPPKYKTTKEFKSIIHRKEIQLPTQRRKGNKIIALYNFDSSLFGGNVDFSKCRVRNCELVSNYAMTNRSSGNIVPDVVMFDGERLPERPSRNQNQIFIYVAREPSNAIFSSPLKLKLWKNQFNMTMTYRVNSDVYIPQFVFRRIDSGIIKNNKLRYIAPQIPSGRKARRKVLQKNYYQIVQSKHSQIAWIPEKCCANCDIKNTFVKELREHYKVDRYDFCNYTKNERDISMKRIIQDYKFLLILDDRPFEDYISKEMVSFITENVILILKGNENYRTQLPPGSYIDIDKYTSTHLLANYLGRLITNDKVYSQSLRAKDMYELVPPREIGQMAMCELCRKLENIGKSRKTIGYLENWWNEVKHCLTISPTTRPGFGVPIRKNIMKTLR